MFNSILLLLSFIIQYISVKNGGSFEIAILSMVTLVGVMGIGKLDDIYRKIK